ncbi:hypothetical protein VE01_03889 [Pseudogymnoascus verrucosus]|uniref:Ubiquitinyl hydrolase 1 n=1 Tax=Pseudogymnoascus verrucosus TaxID=342668 RepID=A0A1B8GQ70_9PEZI|nr:uncharacterized protein VE01_03889 [Pseudogymnoascus verrucosus]OBT97972.2 hypothetical protein VE01_03889 [Pseudogymnoascus verrucosus]
MVSLQAGHDTRPPADAYEHMITTLLPMDPDLEIEQQTSQTWQIQDWKKLEKRVYWPTFECGGSTWRVLMYPSGNNVEFVSMYLEAGPKIDKEEDDWYACAEFAIVLWNPSQPSKYVSNVAKHRFHTAEKDWGFTRFSQLKSLFGEPGGDPESFLLQNGEANITAYVRVYKDPTGVLWENFLNYDSKKATGMVGLRNQGSTGYLNVVLQALYFITAIRKVVYEIPTREGATTDVAWALQRLFYSLQTSETFATTKELTNSFGWSPMMVFQQQDVVEMLQILISQLMTRAEGTRSEDLLLDLFIGRQRFLTSSANDDRVTSRSEDLYILSLNIHGQRTLQESLAEYVKVDTFNAGAQDGPQEMKRGMIVDKFPPILHLQLKRFQYDISEDAMVKLDDFFEFPDEIDLSPYLAANADRSEPWTYVIYGVVAHSGGIAGGQYSAFLRPAKDGQFYKFDDERVTKATLKEAIHNNFGTEDGQPSKKPTAYLLIYIRKSRLGDLLGNFTKDDVPQRIMQELTIESAEKARKAEEEEKRQLYVEISLISDETFQHHRGLDLSTTISSPTDLASPKAYSILGAATLAEFILKIAAEKGLKSKKIRFWLMANRQNKTIRPQYPLENHTETFDQIIKKQNINDRKIRLYAEEMEPEKSIWPLREGLNGEILLFLKHYNPLQEQVLEEPMRGVCHIYVRKNDKASELSARINRIMNWPAAVQMILFEEIKPGMTTMMDPSETFQGLELQDGDIVRFQRTTESLILSSSLADNVAEIRI